MHKHKKYGFIDITKNRYYNRYYKKMILQNKSLIKIKIKSHKNISHKKKYIYISHKNIPYTLIR